MRAYNICGGHSLRIAVGITMFVLLIISGANAATLTVDDGGGAMYTRVQDAVNAANIGDTILVYDGTYYESVSINKQLILKNVAGNNPVIDANGLWTAIYIYADGITVDGFTIINAANSGIYASGYPNNIITNNTVNSSGWNGINLYNCNNCELTNNNVKSNGNAIYVYNSNNINIFNNNVSFNNGSAITMSFSRYNNISNNYVNSNKGTGINVVDSYDNILINNNANLNTAAGIRITRSNNNTLISNMIGSNAGNVGLVNGGLVINLGTNNRIRNNIFENNGLYIQKSYNNEIQDNIVNGKQLVYLENVSDQTITDAGQVVLVSSRNITVENLNLSYASTGLLLLNTSYSLIKDNIMKGNLKGIDLTKSYSNNLTNNNVSNDKNGIILTDSSYNIIMRNIAINDSSGITITNSSYNYLENNIANNNYGYGISIVGSNNTVRNNVASNNYNGLHVSSRQISIRNTGYIFAAAVNNTIANNNISNNINYGIYLDYSGNNTLTGNNIELNNVSGLALDLYEPVTNNVSIVSPNRMTIENSSLSTTSYYFNFQKDSVGIYDAGFALGSQFDVEYYCYCITNNGMFIPDYILKDPIVLGDTWTINGAYRGYNVTSTTTVQSISDTVIVEAGTFTNVVRTRQTRTFPNGYSQDDYTYNIDRWYSPDVGLIKVKAYTTNGNFVLGELKEYHVFPPSGFNYYPMDLGDKWEYKWAMYTPVNPRRNKIYDNQFNNINNFIIKNGSINRWNTTKTLGTNIVGGTYLGGNSWTNPSGTGFSQICTDSDNDGICDSSYSLNLNNTDFFPLAVDLLAPPQVDINILKFKDLNADGIQNNSEPVLSDWNFTIVDKNGNNVCSGSTDLTGNLHCWINTSFNPPPYTLVEETKPGWTSTTPNPLTLFPLFSQINVSFGNMVISGKINGTKFNDSNGNGVRDGDETGLSGVTIKLTHLISPVNEEFVGITSTDSNGDYIFEHLLPGFYKVEELAIPLWSQTYPASGNPHFINLSEAEVKTGVDFGNQQIPPGEIRGVKFNDSNGNGVQDAGESGMSGVSICISPSWRCTDTNSTGDYNFTNVPPGTYTVYESMPPGYLATTPTMVTATITFGEVITVNFGNRLPVPPPEDVSVAQQYSTQDGIPTVLRPGLTNLTIKKNLTGILTNVVSINLTLNWGDGTSKTASMAEIDSTNVWITNISGPYFPPGLAQMRFEVDVAPTGNWPGPEDALQIGDIMFIDPSGQIRSTCTNVPVSGATATLLIEWPPTTGYFEISPPANQIPPTNPQITGVDGKYSWLTVPGTYKVRAERPGFVMNESPPVSVPPAVENLDIDLIPNPSFTDVSCGFWAYDYIEFLKYHGIINGVGGGLFDPENTVTRAQFSKMITNANNLQYVDDGIQDFSDVPTNHWAYFYIKAAKQNGVINGIGGGLFDPENTVTRAQIAKMVTLSKGITYVDTPQDFSDVPTSDWAYFYIKAVKQAGIVNGYEGGTFGPVNSATRAEASKMVANMLLIPDTIAPVITITSPISTTYATHIIPLTVSADELTSTWLYSLNGAANVSFTPGTTLIAPEGTNSIIVYASDIAGNWNSQAVSFIVDTMSE